MSDTSYHYGRVHRFTNRHHDDTIILRAGANEKLKIEADEITGPGGDPVTVTTRIGNEFSSTLNIEDVQVGPNNIETSDYSMLYYDPEDQKWKPQLFPTGTFDPDDPQNPGFTVTVGNFSSNTQGIKDVEVFSSTIQANQVLAFSSTTNSWRPVSLGSAEFPESRVYIGNFSSNTSDNLVDVEVFSSTIQANQVLAFSSTTNSWRPVTLGSAEFPESRVYIGNFSSNTSDNLVDVEVFSSTIQANQILAFSSTTNTWRAVTLGSAEFPESRVYIGNFSSNTSDNLVDVEVFSSTISANQILAFSSTTNTWRAVTLGSAEFPESRVYIGNFSSNTSDNLVDVDVFSSTVQDQDVLFFSSSENKWLSRQINFGNNTESTQLINHLNVTPANVSTREDYLVFNSANDEWSPIPSYYSYEEASGQVIPQTNDSSYKPVLGLRFYNFGSTAPRISAIEYIVSSSDLLQSETFEMFYFDSAGDRLATGSAPLSVLTNGTTEPSDPTVDSNTKLFIFEPKAAPNATGIMLMFQSSQPYPESLKMTIYSNASEGWGMLDDVRHRFLELGGWTTNIRSHSLISQSDGFHEYEFVPTTFASGTSVSGHRLLAFSSTSSTNFKTVNNLMIPFERFHIDGLIGTNSMCLTMIYVNQISLKDIANNEYVEADFSYDLDTQGFVIENCNSTKNTNHPDGTDDDITNLFDSTSSFVGGYTFTRPYLAFRNQLKKLVKKGFLRPQPTNNSNNAFGMTISTDSKLLGTAFVSTDSEQDLVEFTFEHSGKVYVVPQTAVYRIEIQIETLSSNGTYFIGVQTQDKVFYKASDDLNYDTANTITHLPLNAGDYLMVINDTLGNFNTSTMIDNSGNNYFKLYSYIEDHPAPVSNAPEKTEIFIRDEDIIELGLQNTTQIDIGTSDTNINIKGEKYPPDIDFLHNVDITSPTDNQILVFDSSTQTWKNEDNAGGGGGGADELNDLTDVTVSAPSSGELLIFNSNTNLWENSSPTLNTNSDVQITSATNNQILEYSSSLQKWVNVDFPGVSEQYTTIFSSGFAFNQFVQNYWGLHVEFESDESGANIAVLSEIVWDFSSGTGSLYGGYPGVYDWHQFVHYFDPCTASVSDAIYPAPVPWDGSGSIMSPTSFSAWVDNLWDTNENPAINTFSYDYDDGGGTDTYEWDILRYPYVTFNSSTASKTALMYQQVVGEGELTTLEKPSAIRVIGKWGDNVLCHDPTLRVANGFTLADASTAAPQYSFSSVTSIGTKINLLKGCYRKYFWNTITSGNISFSSTTGTTDTSLSAQGEDSLYTGVRRFITADDITFPASNVKTITLQRPAKAFYVCALGPTPDTFSPATEVDSFNPTATNYWNEAWFTTLNTVYVREIEITKTDGTVVTSGEVTLDSLGSEDNWGNVITRETNTSQGFESTGNYFGGGCSNDAFFRVTLDDDTFVKSVKFTTTMPAVSEPVNINLTDWKYGFTQMQYLLGIDELYYEKVQVTQGTDNSTTISNLETAYLQEDVTVYEIDNPGIYKLEARMQVTAGSPQSQFKFVVIKNNGSYGIFKSDYQAFNQVQSLQWIELEEGDHVTLQIDEHEGETFDEEQSYFSLAKLGSTMTKEPDDDEWRIYHITNTEATQFADYLATKETVLTHAGSNIAFGNNQPFFIDFEYLPKYGRILAAHKESKDLHYSDDDGETWTSVDFSSTIKSGINGIVHFQYDQKNDYLYASAMDGGQGASGRIVRSLDGGATWESNYLISSPTEHASSAGSMILVGTSEFGVGGYSEYRMVVDAATDFEADGLNNEILQFSSSAWRHMQKAVYSEYYQRCVGYGYSDAVDDTADVYDIRSFIMTPSPNVNDTDPVILFNSSNIDTNRPIGLPAQAKNLFVWGAENGRILYSEDLQSFTYYQLDSQTNDLMVFYLDGYDLFLAVTHENSPDAYIARDPTSESNWTKLETSDGSKPLASVDLNISDIFHPNAPNRMIRSLPNGRIIIGSQNDDGTVWMTKAAENTLINIGNSLAKTNITTKDLDIKSYGTMTLRGAGSTKVDGNILYLGQNSEQIIIGNRNSKIRIENLFEPYAYSCAKFDGGAFAYSSGWVDRDFANQRQTRYGKDIVYADVDNDRIVIRQTGLYYVTLGVTPFDGIDSKRFWFTIVIDNSPAGPISFSDSPDIHEGPCVYGEETNNGVDLMCCASAIMALNQGSTLRYQYRQELSSTNPQHYMTALWYISPLERRGVVFDDFGVYDQ